MEAKASKHASKCEHACARVRACVCVRARARARGEAANESAQSILSTPYYRVPYLCVGLLQYLSQYLSLYLQK